MKKLLIVSIITILGLLNSVKAQNVDFGVKTGLNIANFNGTTQSASNVFDYHVGIFSEFKLNEKFSFQPELLYSRQGSEFGDSFKIKANYLAIPILAKYYLFEKISIEFGPQLSFLVDEEIEPNGNSNITFQSELKSFDFGLNLGLAFNISPKLFTQVRYNFGISSVATDPDVENSVFQLSIGYKL